MKKFISQNWYKLMIGSSLLMASFGFMIHSVTSANAKELSNTSASSNYQFPVSDDGSISVKLSDEQLNKIVPKNEDGSINVKLSKEQLHALTPNEVQDINLVKIKGWDVWAGDEGGNSVSLGVTVRNPW